MQPFTSPKRDLYGYPCFSLRLLRIAGVTGAMWLGLVALAEVSFAGQHLWLSRSVINLGVLEPNAYASARVWVINPTGQKVVIHPVAGCGCTVGSLRKSVLLPIDVTVIDIRIEASDSVGAYRRRVHLICQAGNRAWREPIEVRYIVRSAANSETMKEGGE